MTDEELAKAKAAWQAAQPQAWEPRDLIHPAQLQVAAWYMPALLAEVEAWREVGRTVATYPVYPDQGLQLMLLREQARALLGMSSGEEAQS